MNKLTQIVTATIILLFTVGMAGLMYVYLPYALYVSGHTGLAITYIAWNVFGRIVLRGMENTLEGYNK